MRTVAGISDEEGSTFEKIGKALFPGAEQAFVELIAFSVPGVARAGLAQAFEKTTYSRKEFKDITGKGRSSKTERTAKFEEDKTIAEEAGTSVVHTMPDGSTMPGPEHEGSVTGSERVVTTEQVTDTAIAPEAEKVAETVAQEQ